MRIMRVSEKIVYQSDVATVEVIVDFQRHPSKIANLSFTLGYDNNVFDLENDDIVFNTVLEESLHLECNVLKNVGEIRVVGGGVLENMPPPGNVEVNSPLNIATITFTPKSTPAPIGRYPLPFKAANVTVIDGNTAVAATPADFEARDGSITIRQRGGGGSSGDGTNYISSPKPTAVVSPSPTPAVSAQPSPGGVNDFVDVGSDYEWAKESIDVLKRRGVIDGTSATTYEPGRDITRAEFSKLVVSTFNFTDVDGAQTFPDVGAGDWFYPYVTAASKAGVVLGYSEGYFLPNALITREEMAAMLIRAFTAAGVPVPEAVLTFADADEVDEWATGYVASLAEMGIVEGRGGNRFVPKANLTRAETAKVIHLALNLLEDLAADAE
jgi:hypothetical protein